MVDAIKIPVIAAGGIMDGRGILAALALGASGVQMGTAFITCKESGAHPIYKKMLLGMKADKTSLTNAFSGKLARGIKKSFHPSNGTLSKPNFRLPNPTYVNASHSSRSS